MIHILDQIPSIADQYLFELRHKDIQKDRAGFRNNLKRMGIILAHEISRELAYSAVEVKTVLGEKASRILEDPPVLIGILRAAQPMMEGFQVVFDESECGYIGAQRVEDGSDKPAVVMGYQAIPDLTNRTVIVIDPMLATGRSIVKTLASIQNKGAKYIHLAVVVAAPEGLAFIKQEVTMPYTLWIGSLDEKLNQEAYIIPGLGDAGDLAYGTKI